MPWLGEASPVSAPVVKIGPETREIFFSIDFTGASGAERPRRGFSG